MNENLQRKSSIYDRGKVVNEKKQGNGMIRTFKKILLFLAFLCFLAGSIWGANELWHSHSRYEDQYEWFFESLLPLIILSSGLLSFSCLFLYHLLKDVFPFSTIFDFLKKLK